MNTRISSVRKNLKMTQASFGKSLGVSRDVIANLESGRVSPNDTFIQLLCSKYSVNETWLRTGDGEMFSGPERSLVERLCAEKGATELERQLLEAYFEIDERVRGPFVSQLMNGLLRRAEAEVSSDLSPALSVPPVTDADVEAQTEAYRQRLLEEKKRASQISAVKESGAG